MDQRLCPAWTGEWVVFDASVSVKLSFVPFEGQVFGLDVAVSRGQKNGRSAAPRGADWEGRRPMSLRDSSVYIRLSSYQDWVHGAEIVELLSQLDEWNQGPFELFCDELRRGRPKAVTGPLLLDAVHSLVGGGLHQIVRFRLSKSKGRPVRSVTFAAGAHPYSGVFVSQLDVRVERDWVERNGEAAARKLERTLRTWVPLLRPFQAHVHDTDDNSVQNIGSTGLLERGYGVKVDSVDLASNPGRERVLGEKRFCVNWLTLLGPALIDALGYDTIKGAPCEVIALSADSDRERPKTSDPRRAFWRSEGPRAPLAEARRAAAGFRGVSAAPTGGRRSPWHGRARGGQPTQPGLLAKEGLSAAAQRCR